MEIKGVVRAVLPPKGGENARGKWKSQTIVVDCGGDRPKMLALTNTRYADAFGKIKPGSSGTFMVDPYSRKVGNEWYTIVTCYFWKMD